eukprot:CAMPEP_0181224828 /NCGR_PEP_ID=MMETSP1096-20121128/31347_1 /TAXON_ID=156174 ORGANISM="Chrysochromulina ericina, Strain CCMP281" /NCGR_SAMPLE_ID=MMETSP1096 /ASSEMBLY_ACC=CAM_ASM_000453 /LENGTH=169 /DNA_ID=CAMNT_0023317961 /DNA_START=62 /DNA_END=572 /DNA_ORIENTATION=+
MGELMVRTVPAPRPSPVIKRIHGSDRKAAWEQPKASGLRVAAPFRNRESAWERIMLDSFDKNPTSTHVVNNAWKGNLREFNRRPFDDRGATYAEKKRQGGKQLGGLLVSLEMSPICTGRGGKISSARSTSEADHLRASGAPAHGHLAGHARGEAEGTGYNNADGRGGGK